MARAGVFELGILYLCLRLGKPLIGRIAVEGAEIVIAPAPLAVHLRYIPPPVAGRLHPFFPHLFQQGLATGLGLFFSASGMVGLADLGSLYTHILGAFFLAIFEVIKRFIHLKMEGDQLLPKRLTTHHRLRHTRTARALCPFPPPAPGPPARVPPGLWPPPSP
jgi:hypothetical protein